jgi:hypothetical protein
MKILITYGPSIYAYIHGKRNVKLPFARRVKNFVGFAPLMKKISPNLKADSDADIARIKECRLWLEENVGVHGLDWDWSVDEDSNVTIGFAKGKEKMAVAAALIFC